MKTFVLRMNIEPGDWITSAQLGPDGQGFCMQAKEAFSQGEEVAYVSSSDSFVRVGPGGD